MNALEGLSGARRILVLGGPGAGKTTLARHISRRLGLPRYCLDDIGWHDHAERPDEEKQADIQRMVQEAGWVVDGVIFVWLAPLAEAAEAIVWLDVSWRVAAWRIVKRHILADLCGSNQHPGYRRLWKFLAWSRRYYTAGPHETDLNAPQDTRLATLYLLEPYREKLTSATM